MMSQSLALPVYLLKFPVLSPQWTDFQKDYELPKIFQHHLLVTKKSNCHVQVISAKVPILQVKALVVKNSVLLDFGFGKVSQTHETFLMELLLFGWRHFSKTEVVQNTVLNH